MSDKSSKQITVFAGVLIKDNKLLMIQRSDEELPNAHLKWEFPGGKCNFGETPQAALKREFLEETGIEVDVKELLPFIHTNYWEYSDHSWQTFCLFFVCSFVKQVNLPNDHHVNTMRWFSKDEVKKLDSLPGTSEVLQILERDYSALLN